MPKSRRPAGTVLRPSGRPKSRRTPKAQPSHIAAPVTRLDYRGRTVSADQHTLERFDKLAARLATLMARKRINEAQCLRSERIMYAMREIFDAASPAVRKVLRKNYGWRS